MIIAPLKYFIYKIRYSKILNKKTGYHISLLANETLLSLKQRIKQSTVNEKKIDTDLSTSHLKIGENINQVFKKYGCPNYFKSIKSGGVVHDVVLYKRIIRGQKSKVIYNFINGDIASIGFNISIKTPLDFEKVTSFLKATYFNHIDTNLDKSQSIIDENGNRLIYENAFDITLTYINFKPEIIQNINAAIYQNNYSQVKSLDSKKFELTF